MTDLPERKAGEKYVVKYTANVSVKGSNDCDGSATLNNGAKVSIKTDSKETWNSVEISKAMISKTAVMILIK